MWLNNLHACTCTTSVDMMVWNYLNTETNVLWPTCSSVTRLYWDVCRVSVSTNKIQGTGGGVWFRVWLMTTSKHLISHASFEFLQQGIEYHALYAGENTEHCVYRETQVWGHPFCTGYILLSICHFWMGWNNCYKSQIVNSIKVWCFCAVGVWCTCRCSCSVHVCCSLSAL